MVDTKDQEESKEEKKEKLVGKAIDVQPSKEFVDAQNNKDAKETPKESNDDAKKPEEKPLNATPLKSRDTEDGLKPGEEPPSNEEVASELIESEKYFIMMKSAKKNFLKGKSWMLSILLGVVVLGGGGFFVVNSFDNGNTLPPADTVTTTTNPNNDSQNNSNNSTNPSNNDNTNQTKKILGTVMLSTKNETSGFAIFKKNKIGFTWGFNDVFSEEDYEFFVMMAPNDAAPAPSGDPNTDFLEISEASGSFTLEVDEGVGTFNIQVCGLDLKSASDGTSCDFISDTIRVGDTLASSETGGKLYSIVEVSDQPEEDSEESVTEEDTSTQ